MAVTLGMHKISKEGIHVISRLKQVIKGVPGVGAVRRRSAREGAWLYRPRTLAWAKRRDLSGQLPRGFRGLIRWLLWQHAVGLSQPVGGRLGFRLVRRVHVAAGGGPIRLNVEMVTIFLDPTDPRILAVPGELLGLLADDSALATSLRSGDTFVDVGANHGAFSVAASRFVGAGGQIIAFEPQRRLAPLVEASLAATHGSNYAVLQYICARTRKQVPLFLSEWSSGTASVFAAVKGAGRSSTIVEAHALDELMEGVRVVGRTYIKIDVEGSEQEVLLGARNFIMHHRPRIQMEVIDEIMSAAGVSPEALAETIQNLGYGAFRTLQSPNCPRSLDCLANIRNSDILLDPEDTVAVPNTGNSEDAVREG